MYKQNVKEKDLLEEIKESERKQENLFRYIGVIENIFLTPLSAIDLKDFWKADNYWIERMESLFKEYV